MVVHKQAMAITETYNSKGPMSNTDGERDKRVDKAQQTIPDNIAHEVRKEV